MTQDLANRIRNASFSPVRLKQGYAMGEVDDLLDRLKDAARRGESLAPMLAHLDLPRVRLQLGYNISEVDSLLAALREGGPLPPTRNCTPGVLGPILRRR